MFWLTQSNLFCFVLFHGFHNIADVLVGGIVVQGAVAADEKTDSAGVADDLLGVVLDLLLGVLDDELVGTYVEAAHDCRMTGEIVAALYKRHIALDMNAPVDTHHVIVLPDVEVIGLVAPGVQAGASMQQVICIGNLNLVWC